MSELSPEIIINDFEKLKEIFDKQEEKFIWDIFSNSEFNFNKTLEVLLNESENNEIKKEKFRPMDSLAKIFKNKNDNSYDYQQLD
jgi:hypothetical protein